MKLLGLVRALALLLFFCRCASAAPFQATPLTDFSPDEKYLGSFPGFLYNGSNTLSSTLSTHDQEGRAFASKVQPLNDQGQPDPNGTIVVVGIGQSNWTMDLCARVHKSDTTLPACTAASFIAHADAVDNPKVRIIDCASGGQTANLWFDDSFGNWSRCDGLLANEGLTPARSTRRGNLIQMARSPWSESGCRIGPWSCAHEFRKATRLSRPVRLRVLLPTPMLWRIPKFGS